VVCSVITVITYARENGLKVSMCGTSHSMGGHTIAKNGLQIDMKVSLPMYREDEHTPLP